MALHTPPTHQKLNVSKGKFTHMCESGQFLDTKKYLKNFPLFKTLQYHQASISSDILGPKGRCQKHPEIRAVVIPFL